MKKMFVLLSAFTLLISCTKKTGSDIQYNSAENGVFIINEGNYGSGTGTLSFYSYEAGKVYNDLFKNKNGWPLGNVAYSMNVRNDLLYIVINNSGKIEVINKNSLESVKTINGLISPRYISFISSDKAYVTSIYSDSVAILNLTDNSISGYINLRRTSESIVVTGNKAFVSKWVGGNEIMVINTLNDVVIDSIEVGIEPESMVIDKNNTLWVLCNGGWTRENYAELVKINTTTNEIENTFLFPTKQASPTCLQVDGNGETLYYLESGVKQMSIDASVLPVETLIPESGHYFYKIGINPVNSDIFLTDAVDYQQPGYVLFYKKDGTFVSILTADIIPASMLFKLNDNFDVQ